jgi:hypothetical protein
MDAWIGLVGVIAGALVALSGQYLMRRTEAHERSKLCFSNRLPWSWPCRRTTATA